MTALSRKKLGYALSSFGAPVMLMQDIDELEACRRSGETTLTDLLQASVELEQEAQALNMAEVIAQVLLQRGEILLSFRRHDAALETLLKADEVVGVERQQDLQVKIYAALAETHAQLQNWPEVINVCRLGIELVERYRYRVSGQYLQSSYLRSRIGLYRQGVRAAYQTGDHESMLSWAELSKCRSVLRQHGQSAVTSEQTQRIEEQFLSVCRQIDEARASGGESALPQLLAKRRTLWDLLLIQRNQSSSALLPEFALHDVQAALAADEAILYYYWLDEQTLLLVLIDDRQHRAVLCSLTADQRSELFTFATTVLESLSVAFPGYLQFVDKIKTFANVLLPPDITVPLQAKRRLLISPHRQLHALPFQALPWDKSCRYLIQRFAISYIPNLGSLLLSYRRPTHRSVLALGIRDFSSHGGDIPDLEEIDQEVEELQSLYFQQGYAVETLLNTEANERELGEIERNGKLSDFSCLHISTHGCNVDSDTPMESYLLLHDSVLEGLEIANWRLNAEVTVLSACCSGQRPFHGRGMQELPGDDMFGLQAAFFAAGSKRVLGSLWPVAQDVAHSIVMAFHRRLLDDAPPEVALQQAIIEHLNTSGARFRKSYFWAPFFLTAVGRPCI